jgi:ubiquinone/menaquinone biosynthesis C-methylase UbiE
LVYFDHQPIINAILFGQYKKLMQATMVRLKTTPNATVLQLTCVYGELTPKLIEALSPTPLHITDVAMVQLELAKSKAPSKNAVLAARMNAEQLAYKDDSLSTVVLFYLLHEMPGEARAKVLSEVMRVIPAGGLCWLPSMHLCQPNISCTVLSEAVGGLPSWNLSWMASGTTI